MYSQLVRWICFDHNCEKNIQKATAQLKLPHNDRGETGADELFVSVIDDDVSWKDGCCTMFGRLR